MKRHNRFKRIFLSLSVLLLASGFNASISQSVSRKEIRIPDIPGYKTLKCDFHLHTVFSDGTVWPTVRVREAWMEGLDAIAVTDHIEYASHNDDIKINRNRSFAIAKREGDAFGLIVIHGSEITKKMPPGHFNAIFIKDAESLNQSDWRIAVQNAVDQGAFVFWNHPGWKGQQPDGISKWYDAHTELANKGWMRGIEIVNHDEYYPQVQRWCIEKKLTLIASSDAHDPIQMEYDESRGEKRPLTLVFAKEKTEQAVKEALLARRTAVWFHGDLFGDAAYLKSIFENAAALLNQTVILKGNKREWIPITNQSDLDFNLSLNGEVEGLRVPQVLFLRAGRTALIDIRALPNQPTGQKNISIPYRVTNLRTSPEESLPVSFQLDVKFVKLNDSE